MLVIFIRRDQSNDCLIARQLIGFGSYPGIAWDPVTFVPNYAKG